MSFTSALLYPFLLLFPAAGGHHAAHDKDSQPAKVELNAPIFVPADSPAWSSADLQQLFPDAPLATSLLPDADPEDAWQVRIEQRMTIRITPRASLPMPDMFVGLPGNDGDRTFTERKIGNCLPIGGIVSVRPDRDNRLLLFMRDRRLVSAELDRSCRARDFYLGFLLERSDDGRLCVDRDTLLSRSGMSCKLTRIRQLVEQDH